MITKSKIVLENQEYNGVLDFEVVGNIQIYMEKEYGLKLTIPQIFEAVREQKLYIINELVVQSILRCHRQLKRENILSKLTFFNTTEVMQFVSDLNENSMPTDNKEGKQSEENMEQEKEK